MFDSIDDDTIGGGVCRDKYFDQVTRTLHGDDHNPFVVAEVTADQYCDDEDAEIIAGIQNTAELLSNVDDITVESMEAGQMFTGGPVMNIYGRYRDFAEFETALLGFLSHASGVATAAAKCVEAAGNQTEILSFGSRHVYPPMAGMLERNAIIGGVDGFSNVAAEAHIPDENEEIPTDASGTMPHALMLSYGRGEQEEAWEAFDEHVPDDVPRILLCDTFTDETDEVRRAIDTLGYDLDGVRIDTTGSRRGDFEHIISEVRHLLGEVGAEDVDIYVSGGLEPDDIRELKGIVDGVGVGSYISNADPVDFSLDIVARGDEQNPISKRGKLSGVKYPYRTTVGSHGVHRVDSGWEIEDDGTEFEPLIEDGEIVRDFDQYLQRARENCAADIKRGNDELAD